MTRTTVLLGKFTGIAMALTMVQISWMSTLVLAIRHRTIHSKLVEDQVPVLMISFGALALALLSAAWSHRRGSSFPATLSRNCSLLLFPSALIIASLAPDGSLRWPVESVDPNILWAMILVLQAILILAAVALAASTRLPTAATITISLSTLFGGVIAGSLSRGSAVAGWIPDLQRLWISDGLIRGGAISVGTVAWATLWSVLLIAAILSLGISLFARRDVG